MIKKKELKRELKRMVNELYPQAIDEVVRLAKLRRIDLLERACLELIRLRQDISTYESILEVPYDEIAFPPNGGIEKL